MLAPLAASCEGVRSKGVVDGPVRSNEPLAPFAPMASRLHPLTRWRDDEGGRPVIEARFGLLDKYGLDVRSLGEATFTLSRVDGPEMRWELDLRDPDRNALENFDPVTRLYIAPLALARGEEPEPNATLRLVFVTPDGRSLASEFRLEHRRQALPPAARR